MEIETADIYPQHTCRRHRPKSRMAFAISMPYNAESCIAQYRNDYVTYVVVELDLHNGSSNDATWKFQRELLTEETFQDVRLQAPKSYVSREVNNFLFFFR